MRKRSLKQLQKTETKILSTGEKKTVQDLLLVTKL